MYFKRLELFGFKSFAQKTKLQFEPGVTAIVGPNGCGKSNIADAIKWVLGEQSAKEMRGSRMEDVIFNGTSNKDPINMAEVSLVLSNKDKVLPIDYEEVIITRRLFRSGESQYLLNKMPMRLKDINDLLAGTGIGTSSYSIIEQGRIGLILSTKPEERRHLFEEASGITKYKVKKKEALRKLEHTETNLIRINDITSEVQRQIQSIERQARKAERYKRDFDVLKEMELNHSYFQYRNIMNELKAMDIENQDLKKREGEESSRYTVLTKDVQTCKRVIDDISGDLQKREKEIAETDAAIDKNIHTMRIDRERITELTTSSEHLKREVEVLRDKYEKKKKDLAGFEGKLASISSTKSDKEKTVQGCEQAVNLIIQEMESSQDQIKINKTKVMDIITSQTKTKNELIKLGAEIHNRKTRLRRLKIERENVSREKGESDNMIAQINQKFEGAKEQLAARKNSLSDLKEKLNTTEVSLKDMRQGLSEYKGTLEVFKSKRDMLSKLIERHEGFGESVKAIIEKCNEPGENIKVRLLADIISVASGFEQALESVLGNLTNAVLVDTREEVEQLVGFIKGKNIGKANFIILKDAVTRNYKNRGRIPRSSEPIRDFVKCTDEYKNILSWLLKDTYVVDTPNTADRLFAKFAHLRFVTKNGYLREGPRVFDGSVIDLDLSVLSRKEKINEIKDNILKTSFHIEEKRIEERNGIALLEEYKAKIEEGQRQVGEAELAFVNAETEKGTLVKNINRIDDEKSVLDTEIDEEENTIEILTKRGDQLNTALNKAEGENSFAQNLIINCEEAIKEKSALKESTLLKIADLKGELASIQISYDNILSNHDMRKEECTEIEQDIEGKKHRIQGSLQRIEELSNEILQIEAETHVLKENKRYLDEKREDLINKKRGEIEVFNGKEASLHEQETVIENLRNNIRDLDVKLTKIDFRKTSLVDRISQIYKEDLEGLNIQIEDDANWEDIKERIAELKQKLDKMGPVNLVAIEEHRELEERYSFLTRQKDDLAAAKESLHKAIIKINATTKKLFSETFQKVQAEFRNYFRMLFGGGQAEVYLLDERDVLESGIEIVVRPPGKKLQNILLLSGGEKALTAIALLFSIFKVNPSPFCILDEIDAPLDESNINRFTRVLQEFLKMSQFIIITHNKKTIQMADILYGITMAERGVSKIVSVKFAGYSESDKRKEEVYV